MPDGWWPLFLWMLDFLEFLEILEILEFLEILELLELLEIFVKETRGASSKPRQPD